MADFDYQNYETSILNGVDHAIVPDANPVELVGSAEFFRSLRTRTYGKGVNLAPETALDLR